MGFSEYELLNEWDRRESSVFYRARAKGGPWSAAGAERMVHVEVIHEPRRLVRDRYEAAALLSHHNIWAILELGEADNGLYLVHPAVNGAFLDTANRHCRLAPATAAICVAQLAGAVQHAHEHGVFHCDIKPGKVLVTAEGVPLLTGFDCAMVRFVHPPPPEDGDAFFMGTLAFMAPEKVQGNRRELGPTVDVWGLGALLYTLLTGQPPFQGPSAIEILRAVVGEEAPSPREVEPGVDPDLDAICRKCLRKKPEDRYASAAALAEDLARHQRGEPIREARATSLPRRLGGWMRGWWG